MTLRTPLLPILALLVGCPGSGDKDLSDDTGEPVGAPKEHCGDITADETWFARDNPHTVTCTISVRDGATLTLEPGAQVQFARGDYELRVAPEGAGGLMAEGTEDEPIRLFAVDETETWHSLGFFAGAAPAVLRYVEIDQATTEPGHTAFAGGSIIVSGAEVTLDHVTITRAEECGMLLVDGGAISAESQSLVITGGEGWPVCAHAPLLETLPAVGSDYTGNGYDAVAVDYREFVIGTSTAWRDLEVPYLITDRVEVCGPEDSPPTLTLEPGVDLIFVEDAYLAVGPRAECAANLIAEGTTEAPITFMGEDATTGSWGGVLIAGHPNSPDSSLRHVELGYGGKDYWFFYPMLGALNFYGVGGSVIDSSVHDAACHGIDVRGEVTVDISGMSYAGNGCEDVRIQ
ncbi:MAG: hypothetical protein H6739_07660 [Alphaproteobacteria bacterium]|nr:hypothetical protein [Alphaproteobacteria bacterium]